MCSSPTTRGLLGAGAAVVALLAAKPVSAGKRHRGKGQPGSPRPSCEDQCFDANGQCEMLCPELNCICRSPECMCAERLDDCLDRCPPE